MIRHPDSRSIVTALLLAVAVSACASESSPEGDAALDAAAPTLPQGHPEIAPDAAPTSAAASIEGEVLEILEAGRYTYARLARTDQDAEIWVAGPRTDIAVGDAVGVTGSLAMPNFYSASLDRTFESLLFVQRIDVR